VGYAQPEQPSQIRVALALGDAVWLALGSGVEEDDRVLTGASST